jgi:hypothetical protein
MESYTPPKWLRTMIKVGELEALRAVADAVRTYDSERTKQTQGWLDADDAETMAALAETSSAAYSAIVCALAELDRYAAAAAAEGETSGGGW